MRLRAIRPLMTVSPRSPGRPVSLRRQLILKGLLPMTVVALLRAAHLGVLHMRAADAETQAVAHIQSIRIAASIGSASNDDGTRDALARALLRSAPIQQAILHRNDANDLVVDSGRRLVPGRQQHIWTNTDD